MTNTEVFGRYIFDFKNTNSSNEERISQLKSLASLLKAESAFFTKFLNFNTRIKENDLNKVSFMYDAEGYITYANNIRWFGSGALKEHLLAMPGIKIRISYEEFECYDCFLCRGIFYIKVIGNQVIIEEKFHDIDPEGDFPEDDN